jgi:hypothetical protein
VGSALSGRLAHSRRSLTVVLGAAVGLIVIGAFTLQPLLRGLIDQPFALRVVLTVILLAPTGVVLGMPMPMGLKRFSALHPAGVPYAWGVNGIASVLASVLGITIAINFGYVVASLVAAACYAGAMAHAAYGRWAAGTGDTAPGTNGHGELPVAKVLADTGDEAAGSPEPSGSTVGG